MSFSNRVDQGYLSFAKGLVTEYNPLAAPEGTTSDELNMDIDTNGMVRIRRNPLEEVTDFRAGISTGKIVAAEHWERFDRFVYVLEMSNSTSSDVQTLNIVITPKDGLPVTEFLLPVDVVKAIYVEPDIKFVRDLCVIVAGGLPYVMMREPDGRYTVLNISIQIRDFKLLDDTFRISQRPGTINIEHRYNLLNSGWYQDRKVKNETKSVIDPIGFFHSVRNQYPSNADIPYLGDITDSDGDLVFDPSTFDNIDTGSTEAPRGHYIYSIRDIDRQSRHEGKGNDGSLEGSVIAIVEDGEVPGTGQPPDPGDPYVPPSSGYCDPLTGICRQEP